MDKAFFKDILSFDGKIDKGSARKKGYIVEDTKPLNVLNVYSDKLQMCIEQEVISNGGDYCIALKANQENFYKDIQDYFDEDKMLIIQSGYEGGYQLTREKNHEAVITYEYYQTEKVNWYPEKKLWEGLKSIGLVKKNLEKSNGEKVVEKRYYISSLLLDISLFSYAIRAHWNVENKLHWHMDFTFKSDDNTTMNKKALLNLQIIKKYGIVLYKKSTP